MKKTIKFMSIMTIVLVLITTSLYICNITRFLVHIFNVLTMLAIAGVTALTAKYFIETRKINGLKTASIMVGTSIIFVAISFILNNLWTYITFGYQISYLNIMKDSLSVSSGWGGYGILFYPLLLVLSCHIACLLLKWSTSESTRFKTYEEDYEDVMNILNTHRSLHRKATEQDIAVLQAVLNGEDDSKELYAISYNEEVVAFELIKKEKDASCDYIDENGVFDADTFVHEAIMESNMSVEEINDFLSKIPASEENYQAVREALLFCVDSTVLIEWLILNFGADRIMNDKDLKEYLFRSYEKEYLASLGFDA